MNYTHASSPMRKYAQISVQPGIEDASPHRIVQMLLIGALDRVAKAKGLIEQNNVPEKGKRISEAISIVNGLRSSLDMNAGGDVASNLEALYEYMEHRLLTANLNNDTSALDEVAGLLMKIKSGWDEIAEEAAKLQKAG